MKLSLNSFLQQLQAAILSASREAGISTDDLTVIAADAEDIGKTLIFDIGTTSEHPGSVVIRVLN